MNTRRSLTLTICGVVMLALAGSAAAQPDVTAATAAPAETAVLAPTTGVALAPAEDLGYEQLTLRWSVPAGYQAACTDVSGGTGTACTAADQTPLTGFTVYYAERPFTTVQQTGVMSVSTSGGTALTNGMGTYTLEGLEPATRYYLSIAPVNAFATGCDWSHFRGDW